MLLGKDTHDFLKSHFEPLGFKLAFQPNFTTEFPNEPNPLTSESVRHGLAEVLAKTHSTAIARAAEYGSIDRLKQGALYVDEAAAKQGKTPFDVPKALAEAFIEVAHEAIATLDSPMLMNIAKVLYRARVTNNVTIL